MSRKPLGVIKPLLVLIALGILDPAAGRLLAEKPLSAAQKAGLATEALKHTPEHTHFAKGTRFSWVLFVVPTESRELDLLNRIRSELAQRYQVYDSEEDLPAGSVQTTDCGKAYANGFVFTVTATRVDADIMEMRYVDFENSLAAGEQKVRYRWNGSRWKVVHKGPLIVS